MSEVALQVVHYTFGAIMAGVAITWLALLRSMLNSFAGTPRLEEFPEYDNTGEPLVSIILPARNESKYIAKCLESLESQDYGNLEIIAIDDSSEDDTGDIIEEMASRPASRIIRVSAPPKPAGWMGKNWACMKGYERASGEMLLFTDADTVHRPDTVSLATRHLISKRLDALTGIPRILGPGFWMSISLPVIIIFMYTRFSALRVNDPSKKTGYFFGSFFILRRETYKAVGCHEGVRREIVEDGALGNKVKSAGFPMRMVRAEGFVEAVWARDASTLWQALRRFMVPLYAKSKWTAAGIVSAVTFTMALPFVFLGYSISSLESMDGQFLAASSAAACLLIYVTCLKNSRYLGNGIRHWAFTALGCLVITAGFLSGLLTATRSPVVWRGRRYSASEHGGDGIHV